MRIPTFRAAALLAGLAVCLSLPAAPGLAAGVTGFSPTGEVGEARQVRAVFSAPMVRVGQEATLTPFEGECDVPGNGYWADERTWVYDLHTTLQAGQGCRLRLASGVATLSGEAVTDAGEFAFRAAGPRVARAWPAPDETEWESIDEDQHFILFLNGAAKPESIAAHARCEVQGIHERIKVVRLTGKERARLLKQQEENLDSGNTGWKNDNPVDDPRLEVVRCQRTLPADARLHLVWGEGIEARAGGRNTVEQRLAYQVRPHFAARMRCDRENARAGCIPLLPVRLEFTAPVAKSILARVTLTDDKGKRYPQAAFDEDGDRAGVVRFPGPFPAQARLKLGIPAGVKDDKGRALVNAGRFPLTVALADWPPLVKFAADFGIIERQTGGLLPVTLRNLEAAAPGAGARVRWLRLEDDAAILDWRRRLNAFEHPEGQNPPDPRGLSLLAQAGQVVTRDLPRPNGAQAFEVVGIPLEKPGFYVVEAESRRLGESLLDEKRAMYVRTTALVTNLAVHFKWGLDNSLAWVTRLDSGQPVAGARVAVRDCKGRPLAQAETDARGVARIGPALPDPRNAEWDCPLMVSARQGDDLSFALSDWEDGIERWRFGLPSEWSEDRRLAHTVLDRVLFRPGETVHMKHLLRDKVASGLALPEKLPRTLMIRQWNGDQRWYLPLTWQRGGAETTWKIPEAAARGEYSLFLVDKAITPDAPPGANEYVPGLEAGAFTVGDFRVPLMKAGLTPVRAPLIGPEPAGFDLAVSYLSGGGAKKLPVKLRAQLEPDHSVSLPGWTGYDFAERADTENGSEEGEDVPLPGAELRLNDTGTGRVRLAGLPRLTMPHQLRVELEYADPNGETQTVSRRVPWWPSGVVLGMKRGEWVGQGRQARLPIVAVDPQGKPLPGVKVEGRFELRQSLTQRVRLAGGFYGYRNDNRSESLGTLCQGHTNAKGEFLCEARFPRGGEVIARFQARDAQGRPSRSSHSFWVEDGDDWWFAQTNHDRIDLLPERKRYEPGETARFQVRMPFRQATALVTVEREGVIESHVVKLSSKSPLIELPVKRDWAPNVYISALVVRGRDDAETPTALVDLGRPAFKLGIAGIQVGQRRHTLNVTVKTDKSVYQTREKARARIQVRTPEGQTPPPGTRLIVAAVDEGLLELADNRSWDVLQAMMAERGYLISTFTAQMQVTGKRHFGKKALPAGGGGGRLPTRELFDTLLFWQAGVATDTRGEATVEIPLNDSLTRFRVVAIAVADDRFGTGQAGFRATRDLQLLSGLPPLARQGDRLQGRFTVRNGSEQPQRLEVTGRVSGLAAPLAPQRLELAPGEGKEIAWPVTVPADARRLEWTLEAREIGGPARDALKVSQDIEPAVPVRVRNASLYRLDGRLDIPLAPPAGALPGRGEVRATLAASLVDGQGSLRAWMRQYPYACLEQQASRAVALGDEAQWREVMGKLPTYLAGNGLANFFPGAGTGQVALTAYLLALGQETGWNVPVESRARMIKGLEDYLAGRLPLSASGPAAPEADTVRRLAALEALARLGQATPDQVATVRPAPHNWPTSAVIDWLGVLQRVPGLARADALKAEALAALDARLSYTGQRLLFSSEQRDGLWWMMTSPDTNAARALLATLDLPEWRDRVPRLVTGALARQRGGRWDTTTANAWGSLALKRYAQRFEATGPSGRSRASLGRDSREVDWRAFPNGATAFLPLPAQPATLTLKHEGAGQPWVDLSISAAVPLTAPVARGYSVKREVSAIERKVAGKWSRGDVVRVRLTLDARDDMGWVVVSDPIPAGASLLGTGLKRDSALLTGGEKHQGAWPVWEERRFDGYRAYYETLPRGRTTLEYTVRLNSDGVFQLPPTRVEAMYAPEMFGEVPNPPLTVAP